MTEAGVSDRDKRGSIDMVAAAIFLQSYLDACRNSGEGPQ
jgi:RNase H-fold protein (predicted Holliday junction resolvase)